MPGKGHHTEPGAEEQDLLWWGARQRGCTPPKRLSPRQQEPPTCGAFQSRHLNLQSAHCFPQQSEKEPALPTLEGARDRGALGMPCPPGSPARLPCISAGSGWHEA